ncbi:hypothetical protein GJ496_008492 [Pomphorhynchus laevis]|nr:hypothetical protein GJ496_008492 [Pomphorhynchus laevis]
MSESRKQVTVRPRSGAEPQEFGKLGYDPAERATLVDRLAQSGNYIHMGIHSIAGADAVDWRAGEKQIGIGRWFSDLIETMRVSGMQFALDDSLNAVINYAYYTANAGNSVNHVEANLDVMLARERRTEVGDYRIEFRSCGLLSSNLSERFSMFYRGNTIDSNAVSNEIQIQLQIPGRLAQNLLPVISLGLATSSAISFYAVAWLLYLHRLFYLVNDTVPVLTAIGVDRFEWLNLEIEDNQQMASIQKILNAISNHRLILRAERFSIDELAILRLIANGLPRLNAGADSQHVMLLDNTHTPIIPMLVIGRSARPDFDVGIPDALDIYTTILKVGVENGEIDQCYCGLVKACATAVRFRAGEDNLTLLDGFLQHRRSCWASPIFKNPFIDFLNLDRTEVHPNYTTDLNAFIRGSAEEQFFKVVITACVISVSTSTIFHRWSFNSNLIQLAYNKRGFNRFAAGVIFFEKRVNASSGKRTCNLMTLVSLLINDLCERSLPVGCFQIMAWNGALTHPITPVADNAAWLAGWPRRVPYPVPPQAVLTFFRRWPTIWGFLGMPVTYTVGREIFTRSNINEAWIDITRGDDLILDAATNNRFFISSGYTTAVINAISQHCQVPAWNPPNCYIMGRDGSTIDMLVAEDVIPSLDYDAQARLFIVGTLWHFCWSHFAPIGVRWRRNQLTVLVRSIFTSIAPKTLVAGVSKPGAVILPMVNDVNKDILDEEFCETE